MTRRSKKHQTRKSIDQAVRRLIVATRDHEMKGARDPADHLSIELEFERAWASLNARIDLLLMERDELVELVSEAYVAAGSLLIDLGAVDKPHATKLLDNLAEARIKHKDVVPFPSYKKAVKP